MQREIIDKGRLLDTNGEPRDEKRRGQTHDDRQRERLRLRADEHRDKEQETPQRRAPELPDARRRRRVDERRMIGIEGVHQQAFVLNTHGSARSSSARTSPLSSSTAPYMLA